MSAAAIAMWTFPHAIIAAYIDTADPANRDTVQIGRRLLAVAALFQVFDGMQTIAAGALRGHKDTMVPMALATFTMPACSRHCSISSGASPFGPPINTRT
jgi:MATE family multidrug resistance protein